MSQSTILLKKKKKNRAPILKGIFCSGPILNFYNSSIKLSTENIGKLKMRDVVAR